MVGWGVGGSGRMGMGGGMRFLRLLRRLGMIRRGGGERGGEGERMGWECGWRQWESFLGGEERSLLLIFQF